MPDFSAEIAQLEMLINSAATNVSADGLSTAFDLEHAKNRLAELRRLQNDLRLVRPRIATLNLEACW
jgi:hypothetical protein